MYKTYIGEYQMFRTFINCLAGVILTMAGIGSFIVLVGLPFFLEPYFISSILWGACTLLYYAVGIALMSAMADI